MCLSPHEMSNKRIDEIVISYTEFLDGIEDEDDNVFAQRVRGQLENYEALRKERAERGVDVVMRGGRAVEVPLADVTG